MPHPIPKRPAKPPPRVMVLVPIYRSRSLPLAISRALSLGSRACALSLLFVSSLPLPPSLSFAHSLARALFSSLARARPLLRTLSLVRSRSPPLSLCVRIRACVPCPRTVSTQPNVLPQSAAATVLSRGVNNVPLRHRILDCLGSPLRLDMDNPNGPGRACLLSSFSLAEVRVMSSRSLTHILSIQSDSLPLFLPPWRARDLPLSRSLLLALALALAHARSLSFSLSLSLSLARARARALSESPSLGFTHTHTHTHACTHTRSRAQSHTHTHTHTP